MMDPTNWEALLTKCKSAGMKDAAFDSVNNFTDFIGNITKSNTREHSIRHEVPPEAARPDMDEAGDK
jgi:hypothetical protein